MPQDSAPKSKGEFSPRNLLRARRPERFSDSVVIERSKLDRAILEYHLETLTNRSQELLFEGFARHLAQAEICPNLLPHTGPTGGGDSKVDAETYPVADTLTAGWYVGVGGAAAAERWAFAFSAKKDWLPKLRDDVAEIALTKRGYKKVFFITNQYVRDKQRAAEEDSFSKKYGLDVRILDRTWILDRVFAGRHEDMAIFDLAIAVSRTPEVRKGPLDTQREQDLEEVEARIQNAVQGKPGLSFVDDCLEAALLARNLERPRPELDGLFARARRAAEEHGTTHQQILAVYEQAWTAFWGHEDYSEFLRLYTEVESRASDSANAADLELMSTLWTLLRAATRHGHIDVPAEELGLKQLRLETALERLAKAEDRPSAALQARALHAQMRVLDDLAEVRDGALRDLESAIADSEGLIGFPLAAVNQFVVELSDYLVGNPVFEDLFNVLVEVIGRRRGEVAAARMLLKLGAAQLDAERPYDAIRTLGQALGRLYKNESRQDMVRALFLCASAYERVGLLWAARGTCLTAASIATNEWWTHSEVTLAQANCYNRLKWIELQLGRVPHVLAWHETDAITREVLAAEGYNAERLASGERDFDAILGILLLRCDPWQLKQLETLPDALDKLGLNIASLCLAYALGHLEGLPDEIRAKGDVEVRSFFAMLARASVAADLPPSPVLCSERVVTLRSVIIGCEFQVAADNVHPCVELAEAILATLESLLSTSLLEGIVPLSPQIRVRLRLSDFAEFPFKHSVSEEYGRPVVDIRCAPFKPYDLSAVEQRQLSDALADLTAMVLAKAFFIAGESELRRVFDTERGLDRAITFTNSFSTVTNVLGKSPKFSIEQWALPTLTRFPSIRADVWDADDRRTTPIESRAVLPNDQRGASDVSDDPAARHDAFDSSRMKHSDVSFESIIRLSLWDRAHWRAVAFVTAQGAVVPPAMFLAFEDGKTAAEIFRHLVEDVGREDPGNRLRITIVKGISKKNLQHYRVVVGSNIAPANKTKLIAMMARVQEMTPETDTNLKRFLDAYAAAGKWYLGVARILNTPQGPTFEILQDGSIAKEQLIIREAWEIGVTDQDAIGVSEGDDVAIPDSRRSDAPVLELLRWKREQRAAHGNSESPRAPRAPRKRGGTGKRSKLKPVKKGKGGKKAKKRGRR